MNLPAPDEGIKNQCRTCGKIPGSSGALKVHFRTHTENGLKAEKREQLSQDAKVEAKSVVVSAPPLASQFLKAPANVIQEAQGMKKEDGNSATVKSTNDADKEIKMLQQQNKVNLQIIQYLSAQVNYLQTQRSHMNEDHLPNTSLAFNPILNLISSAPGTTSGYPESNHTFANCALAQASNRPLNNFPVSVSVEAKPFASGHFNQELEKKKSILIQNSYPALPTAKVDSAIATSNALQNNVKPIAPSNNDVNFILKKGIKNQCQTCGKVLSSNSSLKRHYRTHISKRSFR